MDMDKVLLTVQSERYINVQAQLKCSSTSVQVYAML